MTINVLILNQCNLGIINYHFGSILAENESHEKFGPKVGIGVSMSIVTQTKGVDACDPSIVAVCKVEQEHNLLEF